jgi:hypothetical protein
MFQVRGVTHLSGPDKKLAGGGRGTGIEPSPRTPVRCTVVRRAGAATAARRGQGRPEMTRLALRKDGPRNPLDVLNEPPRLNYEPALAEP